MSAIETQPDKVFDLVVVGELNADLILRGEVIPEFGQVEKLLDDATLTLGSSSAIFACGAARLGLRVAFIGKIGDDEFGRFVQRELETRGVDTRGVVVDLEIKTGLSVILSRGNDRAILTHLGSIAALRYAEIDHNLLRLARHLHLGSYFLLHTLRPNITALFEVAHSLGITVSLDTNYDPAEKWDGGLSEVLRQTDLFLPNETELLAIARAAGVVDPSLALDFIAEKVPTVAVKLGSRGAVAQRGGQVVQAKPLPVTVVDTTGAGDTFDAGFIYGYLSGWDLARTLRLACVCGSLSTQGVGGTAAQPTILDAQQALSQL